MEGVQKYTIKQLPRVDRPREKLIKYGPGKLNNSELLAILLRTGKRGENVVEMARKILQKFGSQGLHNATFKDLVQHVGLGPAKACEIVACFELGKRLLKDKKAVLIMSAQDVWQQMADIRDNKKEHFVVIEKDPNILASMDKDILALQGDSTQDAVLKEVGIDRARGLISVLSSDADNLYVVLSARGLNPKLRIVARASEEGAEQKLIRAGADNVISPYHLGGIRIAHTMLKPAVVDFIEFATRSGNLELQIEEIKVKDHSHIIDKNLDECGIRRELGIIIVAIKRATGEMEFNPTSTSIIRQGDILIAMGDTKELKSLESLVGA